ncbi:hypothetical protein [Candidatus Neptunichlamydia sp. REUL1]|uniref:hypothetical protein n=1 Tax=Candidatus Neptunichlamydia sp. REUL1 TaxID=3064277 RepID=UPI00292F4BCD|nr:hypothetical protein [Candidatus Neptunochlamydia sp. REUL1]
MRLRFFAVFKSVLMVLCLPAIIWHVPLNAEVTLPAKQTQPQAADYTNFSPWDLLNYDTLSYQRITDFLWEIAYGDTLEKNLSSAQANQVMNFVIFLARNGLQDDDIEGKSALEEDIKWLRGEPNNSTLALDDDDDERSEAGNWWWNTSLKGYENYGAKVTPAALYGNQSPRILNCGWISESWKATKKFVKKHKKEVIIAAVVVVAATVVIVATSGAAMPAVVGGAVAASADSEGNGDLKPKGTSKPRTPVNKPGEIYEPYDGNNHENQTSSTHYPSHCDFDRPKEIEALIPGTTPQLEPTLDRSTLLIETIERQNTTLKEELSQEPVIASDSLNIPGEEQPTLWSQAADKAREVGSYVVHEVYDGVTDQLQVISGATGYISEKLNNASEYFSNISPFEKDPRESFQESISAGHEKIDAVFGTEHANMYTDEAKESRDQLTTGMLPPPGGGVKSSSKFYEKNINHIFRSKPGHLIDTQANRKLILEVAGDSKNFLGVDKHRNSWHAKIQKDGTQVWSISRNGEIRDAGVNKKVQNFHKETGLSSSEKPKQR